MMSIDNYLSSTIQACHTFPGIIDISLKHEAGIYTVCISIEHREKGFLVLQEHLLGRLDPECAMKAYRETVANLT